MIPEWLPDKIRLSGQSINADYAHLYKYFNQLRADISTVRLFNAPIAIDMSNDRVLTQYEAGFVHLVTRQNGHERIIDYDRANRLTWILPVLRHVDSSSVRVFMEIRASERVLNVWVYELDYIIILKPARDRRRWILATAYCIDKYKVRTFNKKYQKFKNNPISLE